MSGQCRMNQTHRHLLACVIRFNHDQSRGRKRASDWVFGRLQVAPRYRNGRSCLTTNPDEADQQPTSEARVNGRACQCRIRPAIESGTDLADTGPSVMGQHASAAPLPEHQQGYRKAHQGSLGGILNNLIEETVSNSRPAAAVGRSTIRWRSSRVSAGIASTSSAFADDSSRSPSTMIRNDRRRSPVQRASAVISSVGTEFGTASTMCSHRTARSPVSAATLSPSARSNG